MPQTQPDFSCVICLEVKTETRPRLVGNSTICDACTRDEVRPRFLAALAHEHEYPPMCGKDELSLQTFGDLFDDKFKDAWRVKEEEYGVLAKMRVYCEHRVEGSGIVCGEFLGKKGSGLVVCSGCQCHTCRACGASEASAGTPEHHVCRQDVSATPCEKMEKGVEYQQCPGCTKEWARGDACNHMKCTHPCGTHFCFVCGKQVAPRRSGHWQLGGCPRFGVRGTTLTWDAHDLDSGDEGVEEFGDNDDDEGLIFFDDNNHDGEAGVPGDNDHDQRIEEPVDNGHDEGVEVLGDNNHGGPAELPGNNNNHDRVVEEPGDNNRGEVEVLGMGGGFGAGFTDPVLDEARIEEMTTRFDHASDAERMESNRVRITRGSPSANSEDRIRFLGYVTTNLSIVLTVARNAFQADEIPQMLAEFLARHLRIDLMYRFSRDNAQAREGTVTDLADLSDEFESYFDFATATVRQLEAVSALAHLRI